MRSVSIKDMLGKLRTAIKDLTAWEQGFIESLATVRITTISGAQVEKLEQIYKRHFS
jgi:hypothetical protein